MLFGKPAESSYITGTQKGTQVFVEGELQYRKYERWIGKEKIEWPITEIFVRSLKRLGKAEKAEVAEVATGSSRISRPWRKSARVPRRDHGCGRPILAGRLLIIFALG